MPHLYVVYSDSTLLAIVTKGYEDIVKETLAEVLQSFHEKIVVTKLSTSSNKCCKFQLKVKFVDSSSHFGYPNVNTKESINWEELHVVLLEEMQKINWKLVITPSNSSVENKSVSWTFQSPAEER